MWSLAEREVVERGDTLTTTDHRRGVEDLAVDPKLRGVGSVVPHGELEGRLESIGHRRVVALVEEGALGVRPSDGAAHTIAVHEDARAGGLARKARLEDDTERVGVSAAVPEGDVAEVEHPAVHRRRPSRRSVDEELRFGAVRGAGGNADGGGEGPAGPGHRRVVARTEVHVAATVRGHEGDGATWVLDGDGHLARADLAVVDAGKQPVVAGGEGGVEADFLVRGVRDVHTGIRRGGGVLFQTSGLQVEQQAVLPSLSEERRSNPNAELQARGRRILVVIDRQGLACDGRDDLDPGRIVLTVAGADGEQGGEEEERTLREGKVHDRCLPGEAMATRRGQPRAASTCLPVRFVEFALVLLQAPHSLRVR